MRERCLIRSTPLARLQVETFAARYLDEGFERVTRIEIPGAGHSD